MANKDNVSFAAALWHEKTKQLFDEYYELIKREEEHK